MTTSIEKLLEGVTWDEVAKAPEDATGSIPYATHEGVLDLGGFKIRCARLSSGETVLDADDVNALFGVAQ